MALIRCSECGKMISNNATACPNCGNPMNNATLNLSPSNIFDLACAAYEKGKKLISELSSMAQTYSKEFSFEVAMKEFDLILQAILLNVAVADGYFVENEKNFIDKITDYADILTILTGKLRATKPGFPSITWDSLSLLSNENRKLVSMTALLVLNDFVDDFIVPFAQIDSMTSKDYLSEIKSVVMQISASLALIDGDDPNSDDAIKEVSTGAEVFDFYVGKKWLEVRERK